MSDILIVGDGPWGQAICRTLQWHSASYGDLVTRVGPVITKRNLDDDTEGVILASKPRERLEWLDIIITPDPRNVRAVWLEKPITTDLRETHAILDMLQDKGIHAFVNYTYLSHIRWPDFREQARKVRDAPLVIRVGNWGPFRKDVSDYWDYGPHAVAMALDIRGWNELDTAVPACTPTNWLLEGTQTWVEFGNRFPRRCVEALCSRESIWPSGSWPVQWEDVPGKTAEYAGLPLTRACAEFLRVAGGGEPNPEDTRWSYDAHRKVHEVLERKQEYWETKAQP